MLYVELLIAIREKQRYASFIYNHWNFGMTVFHKTRKDTTESGWER